MAGYYQDPQQQQDGGAGYGYGPGPAGYQQPQGPPQAYGGQQQPYPQPGYGGMQQNNAYPQYQPPPPQQQPNYGAKPGESVQVRRHVFKIERKADFKKSFANSAAGEAFAPTKPKWNDIIFAILFYAQFFAFSGSKSLDPLFCFACAKANIVVYAIAVALSVICLRTVANAGGDLSGDASNGLTVGGLGDVPVEIKQC